MKYRTIIFLIACACTPALVNAQPLGGLYTVANGNPGGAFDYADIGDIFDDLEDFGMNAPVTIELYDVGGPFVSKESYQLGFDGDPGSPVLRPVSGVSSTSPLTIRAAAGHSPTIVGGGAGSIYPSTLVSFRGGLSLTDITHTVVQGIEVTGGDFGIMWFKVSQTTSESIHISHCRIHGITQGSAIGVFAPYDPMQNIAVENNLLWDCNGPGGQAGFGVLSVNAGGLNCVIRNNTISLVKSSGGSYSAIQFSGSSGSFLAELVGNVIYVDHVASVPAYYAFAPLYADGNVFCAKGAARLFSGGGDWAWWQGLGHDLNGLNTDPLFMSVAPGLEDPRLRPDSPAIDLIPSSALTADVFGNPRPYGSGFDAGAHEVQNHGARADAAAGSTFTGAVYGPFDLAVDYGDTLSDARIELTDPEADTISVLSIASQTPTTGISAPGVPAPGHPLMLEWTGVATDTPGTYTWSIEYADAGNGFALTSMVNITINPPPPIIITTPDLPVGIEGSVYDHTIQTADATGAVTFSLQSGALPPGLSLDAGTGAISGTPTQHGLYTFTIQAADSFNTAAQSYDLQIYTAPPPTPPPDQPGSNSASGCTSSQTRQSYSALAALLALLSALATAGRRANHAGSGG